MAAGTRAPMRRRSLGGRAWGRQEGLGPPAPLGTGHGGTDTLTYISTVVTAGPTEALILWLHGGGLLVPVSIQTRQEGSLAEAALGVETWAEASGTGSLV